MLMWNRKGGRTVGPCKWGRGYRHTESIRLNDETEHSASTCRGGNGI